MSDQVSIRELPIPPEAVAASGSSEVLRAWIVDGGLSVSLISAFEQPALWGMLLADVARHAARSFAADGISSEEDALAQILGMLAAELDAPTDLGTTRELKQH